jgi:hypothetical protein
MSYKFSCPVPKEQRPINEYLQLVQSNFFSWPFLEESLFQKKLIKVFVICFFVFLPFSNLFYSLKQSPSKLLLINTTLTTFFMFFLILRLILGWNYIKQRLYNPTIFYEESGWYDGRIWVKSKNILLQDRLIRDYQVVPVINKLNKILLIICLFLSISLLINFFT